MINLDDSHYFLQVDMKIIFYELIRMLVEYGRSEAVSGVNDYDDTKTIPKIEGYQELTNKLLRHQHRSIQLNIQQLQSLTSENNNNKQLGLLESKIEQIEQSSRIAVERVEGLENENKTLVEKIRTFEITGEKLASDILALKEPNSVHDEENTGQEKAQNSKYKKIVDTVTQQEQTISYVIQSDDDLRAKIKTMESKMENLEVTIDSWKEDFDTQNQFEMIKNEMSELKKLPLSHMVDQLSNLERELEEEKGWS